MQRDIYPIITTIFGANAFLIKDLGLHRWAFVLVTVHAFCTAILGCSL